MHRKRQTVMRVIIAILFLIVLAVGIRFLYTFLRGKYTEIEMSKLNYKDESISCAVFDGKRIWEDSTVVIKDGVISEETVLGNYEMENGETENDEIENDELENDGLENDDLQKYELENDGLKNDKQKNDVSESEYFLMPGLIDAHAHLTTPYQMELNVKNGVTTVCDVAASEELQNSYDVLNVWSSRTSAWLGADDAEAFVDNTIVQGGKYIKVVADLPQIMGGGIMAKSNLEEIVRCAHEKNLKVAVHAISVTGVQMAVDSDADMLIHIPIGESFSQELAEQIAEKNIAVMPTLAMMQAFAESPFYGYKDEDYNDAVEAVQMLKALGVRILVATDSSDSFFVPQLKHGESLHKEMELLVEAGMTPLEVLQSATSEVAEAYGIENAGAIAPGMKATMVLVKGRPDKDITASTEIVQIWVDGKPIFK